MFDRRRVKRQNSRDRRAIPRPPMWLNLSLILVAVAAGAFAKLHRNVLDARFADVLKLNERSPLEVNRIKSDLAQMDVTEEVLERELDSRLKLLQSVRSNRFFVAIDTTAKKLTFNYGGHTLRTAPVEVGAPQTVRISRGGTTTFVPIRGAFQVREKAEGLWWQVPEWVYAANKQPVPRRRPLVENGLGRYVIFLSDEYLIHSPPVPESPLKGPKPASFMVPEQDLRSIWKRVEPGTWIYIF